MDNKTASEVSTKLMLLDAALSTLDEMATNLTWARKVLRKLHDQMVEDRPTSAKLPGCEGFYRADINDVILTLNLAIIASRKLVKGEMP